LCETYFIRFKVIISIFRIQVAALPSLLATVDTLRQAIKINNAVLVEGVGSCGKTTVVNTSAMLFSEGEGEGNEEPCLVTLHLGEHTDAKVWKEF